MLSTSSANQHNLNNPNNSNIPNNPSNPNKPNNPNHTSSDQHSKEPANGQSHYTILVKSFEKFRKTHTRVHQPVDVLLPQLQHARFDGAAKRDHEAQADKNNHKHKYKHKTQDNKNDSSICALFSCDYNAYVSKPHRDAACISRLECARRGVHACQALRNTAHTPKCKYKYLRR